MIKLTENNKQKAALMTKAYQVFEDRNGEPILHATTYSEELARTVYRNLEHAALCEYTVEEMTDPQMAIAMSSKGYTWLEKK